MSLLGACLAENLNAAWKESLEKPQLTDLSDDKLLEIPAVKAVFEIWKQKAELSGFLFDKETRQIGLQRFRARIEAGELKEKTKRELTALFVEVFRSGIFSREEWEEILLIPIEFINKIKAINPEQIKYISSLPTREMLRQLVLSEKTYAAIKFFPEELMKKILGLDQASFNLVERAVNGVSRFHHQKIGVTLQELLNEAAQSLPSVNSGFLEQQSAS